MSAVFAIDMLALYWLALVLHSAEPAIVGLSPCRSYLFRSIAIALLALYFPAGDIALCRACYRWSVVLQELSIQKYCYRPAGSLLASVGLALCRACYRSFIVLQELSIQKYCYRPASSLLASVGLALCRACYRSSVACWLCCI